MERNEKAVAGHESMCFATRRGLLISETRSGLFMLAIRFFHPMSLLNEEMSDSTQFNMVSV